jgi:UDP-N-acetyl-D-mannosaminuronic acid dehydrogenase
LNPGPGVGGYCITVNPWFLASSAPDLAVLIANARHVNTSKADWVIQKIRTAIQATKASTVACLGLTYKANSADIRQSSAFDIVQALKKEINVLHVDPYLPNTIPLYEAIASADIIVGLVAHQPFLEIPADCLKGKHILDFAGIFR